MRFVFVLENKFWDWVLEKCSATGQAWFGIWILRHTKHSATSFGQEIYRHEMIHIKQQRECLIVFFYVIYIGHFIENYINLSFNKSLYLNTGQKDSWWLRFWAAYRLITFEVEAYKYENMTTTAYFKIRPIFAWVRI